MHNGQFRPLDNLAGIADPIALRRAEDERLASVLAERRGSSSDDILRLNWLREFHRDVFRDFYEHAGRLRNQSIRLSWHIPADHSEEAIRLSMEQYESDCRHRLELVKRKAEALPALLGFAFWKLVYIAPFVDGNGRCANAQSILLQRSFGLPGVSLYERSSPLYGRFVSSLRSYDAGHATPFFDYLHERLDTA